MAQWQSACPAWTKPGAEKEKRSKKGQVKKGWEPAEE